MQAKINPSFLASPTALKIGFKPERIVSTREDSERRNQLPAVPNTLAQALQQEFITVVSADGFPLLNDKDKPDERVFELDPVSETFVVSGRTFDTVIAVPWGCVAPIFASVVDTQPDETVTAVAVVGGGGLDYETIPQSRIDELREVMEPGVATGFIKDADRFNAVLTRPIFITELRSSDTFHHVFPEDDAIDANLFPCQEPYEKDDVGRIVISYRHQSYHRNRIAFHDWICASHSIERVIKAYGWTRTRIWTDARLRQYAKDNPDMKDAPWAEIGLDPYLYAPVVVLNLSRKQSISERFWLTLERKTGAHYYGTWLTDDSGDSFYYCLPKGDEMYSRAIVTSVSTSQGITWTSDREEVLDLEWDQLEVADIDHALRVLRESTTFEAREDFVDEDLSEISIAEKGKTIQWCGDVEALIDPPSLVEVFGTVGEISHNTQLQVIDVDRSLEDTNMRVVIFRESDAGNVVWIAKRLYIDDTGEIRARSVPRLVDEDYGENLMKHGEARHVDIALEMPSWLASPHQESSTQRDETQSNEDDNSE